MSATAEKARAQRLERLKAMLDKQLDHPSAALEALLSEMQVGEPQTNFWEALHAAALRDAKEQDLALGYQKITAERRLQQFEPWAQAEILVHAADFFQGVLGDAAAAEPLLERVLEIAPDHTEAFARLHRRFTAAGDPTQMLKLYALAAPGQPKSADDFATKAVNLIVPLPATTLLSEDVCKRLVGLAGTHPAILDALEAHCRKTKRLNLTCTLLELAIQKGNLPKPTLIEQRRRLVELYINELDTPANAMVHIEGLLDHDPSDALGRGAAEHLLATRELASRAAAALQKARRQARAV